MQNKSSKIRSSVSIRVLQFVVVIVFLILLGRVAQLQIIEYDTYSPISQRNSIRQELISPARGLVYDRNGQLIIDNQPTFTITVTPINFNRDVIPLLSDITGNTQEEIEERLTTARRYSWHRSSRLFTEVSFEVFSKIQENLWRLPGIGHQIEGVRNYPSTVNGSHIFGYLREVTPGEIDKDTGYRLGDKAGRSGIEQTYETSLRGEVGTQYVTVNAYGQEINQFNAGRHNESPVKGSDIHTTIDIGLQSLAEFLMKGKVGGLVAMDPHTGGILALVSSPDFDIKMLAGRIDAEYWRSVNSDSLTPLFNRSITSVQPPGSTLKPVMGLIGLELGIITPQTTVFCNGGYYRGRLYRCTDSHGNQNLEQSIKNSCNTYYFWMMNHISQQAGLNRWKQMVSDFGLGNRTGIDLPNETRGLVPDSSYFDRVFGVNRWGIGDLINLGVGQGAMGASPLQMAVAASVIANGGYRVQPHIVSSVSHGDGTIEMQETIRERVSWADPRYYDIIRRGMRSAVTEGSGRFYANLKNVAVAGKTGTAQNPHGENHGWFISFAPYEKPELVVAVLIEQGGYGSTSAAPIAAMLMEQYFHGEILRPWIIDQVIKKPPVTASPPASAQNASNQVQTSGTETGIN
jgi:penicillin-binding protein 2